MPNRVCFLVDGFNVYHSITEAMKLNPAVSMKWLDFGSFCRSYLSAIGPDATLEQVFYFSATADWRPARAARHTLLIEALRATGVSVHLGRFKEKDVTCPSCGYQFKKHEEKETDVAIAVKLVELFSLDACDTAVLVTGDTD
ncbi:MAG TPA: NYN domain-containing protein, partial [Gemmatimonadales bacterium]|nr:NYN domain-containing protein [Gemmatimonadales bacterium]